MKNCAPYQLVFLLLGLLNTTIAQTCMANRAESIQPHIVIITVDDMSADSVGVMGCELPDTTPRMDKLAGEGLRFNLAHVQVGNCMPGRNVMWSGRFPHNNGVEGFYQVKTAGHPMLSDLMQQAGYFTAIRGKVSHSTPYIPYNWDLIIQKNSNGTTAHVKDAASYGDSTKQAIDASAAAKKPLCLLINISDPHKPFFAQGKTGATIEDPHKPTRVFTADEVPIPGFLFDDPVVRKELAHYYSSVRRADDCVGEILDTIDRCGIREHTVVIFLSDHGMALPFAKTQLYHHSTHTPLFVRWPEKIAANRVDNRHMVSAVDFLPTILDIAGADHPPELDGRSFHALLNGQSQEKRHFVVKEYNENAGGSRDPMRAVQSKRYLYIYNPWSNGERIFATATSGTPTYKRFKELATADSAYAQRHDIYQHRVVEELYDVMADPNCLNNLIQSPEHDEALTLHRRRLQTWMRNTGDPMLQIYKDRENVDKREAYIQKLERVSQERRSKKNTNKKNNQNNK